MRTSTFLADTACALGRAAKAIGAALALASAIPAVAQSDTILIGQSAPLSGANRELGEEIRDGALAYFKKVNEAGGVNGRRIELITLDDGNDTKLAAENGRKLIEERGVIALFGYASATLSRPAMPVAEKTRTPFLFPFTGADPMRVFNRVLYNHLVDGAAGEASYELEFPNGGMVLAVGNVIQQSPRTQNRTLLAFGAEGEAASGEREHRLTLAHNTWVNEGSADASFVQVHKTRLRSLPATIYQNNLFVGPGSADGAWRDAAQGNQVLGSNAARGNGAAMSTLVSTTGGALFALPAGSALRGQAVAASTVAGDLLRPQAQFVAPAGWRPLPLRSGFVWSPGATQE